MPVTTAINMREISNGYTKIPQYPQAEQISVPPLTEIRWTCFPNAFCAHSNIGGVKMAPVTFIERKDSKEAISPALC